MFCHIDSYIINFNAIKYIELKPGFKDGTEFKTLIVFFENSKATYSTNGEAKYQDTLIIVGDDDVDFFLGELRTYNDSLSLSYETSLEKT